MIPATLTISMSLSRATAVEATQQLFPELSLSRVRGQSQAVIKKATWAVIVSRWEGFFCYISVGGRLGLNIFDSQGPIEFHFVRVNVVLDNGSAYKCGVSIAVQDQR